jgi:hypothetical protein
MSSTDTGPWITIHFGDLLTVPAHYGQLAAVAGLLATFIGASIAILQWLILRLKLKISACLWIVGTTIVWGLSVIWGWTIVERMLQTTLYRVSQLIASTGIDQQLARSIAESIDLVVVGTTVGVFVGIVQWISLRKYVRRSGWWVLANAVGWATSAGFHLIPFGFAGIVFNRDISAIWKINDNILAAWAGIATVVALVQMLRCPLPDKLDSI